MATTELTLRPGDSIQLKLETPGHTLRLDLSLTAQGVSVSPPVVNQTLYEPPARPAVKAPVARPVAPPPPPPPEEPAFSEDAYSDEPLANEPVQAVDVPFEPDQPEASEQQVEDASDAGDIDLSLEDEPAPVPQESAVGEVSQAGELRLTGELGTRPMPAAAEDPLDLDLGMEPEPAFSAEGRTMVPPTQQDAPVLDAISATLTPVNLHDPNTDQSKAGAAAAKTKSETKPEDLPVWTGRARDYRDPILEKKKRETGVIPKAGKPAPAPVRPSPAQAAPAPGPSEPVEEGGDLSLSLDDEPAPAPVAKKPTAKLPGKATKPPGAKTGPVKPAPAPVKAAPAPAAKSSPGPTKAAPAPAAKAAAPAGDYTVFLSPPKGTDKKNAAAEIIAELQGISMNDALALAGKMIVPVVKGVSENEANQVRDRFKDAGLSCRITQKR
ncbi:MAG: hypothetical protein IT463_13170 [Planctomycetes bacterium]|nr:hypothetical protein [Planctomycetota bacterium]